MKMVYVLCEGYAEQHFVHEELFDIAYNKGIFIQATMVTTKIASRKFSGGVSSYSKIRTDLINLCKHSDATVTSMFDLYKLPSNTPGYIPQMQNHYDWAAAIEQAVNKDIGTHNIHFNLSIHEFEALLFSEPMVFQDYSKTVTEMMKRSLQEANGNPEQINSGFDTSPSHRIRKVYPQYSKSATGSIMVKRIGLNKMRAVCPHFNEWISFLGL